MSSLENYFQEHRKVAVAFSGGVDSAYLLYAAKSAGAEITAYYVKSPFQPEFERQDAVRMAKELSIPLKILSHNILEEERVRENGSRRCYYCKSSMLSCIMQAAEEDGYECIIDGTNASDSSSDRPGMKALRELGVHSPLQECGLTKNEIRSRSQQAGLFTWDKPAYACLATRIRTGELIREETLQKVEQAEGYLMSLGFSDLRVRVSGDTATLQLPRAQFSAYDQQENVIRNQLKRWFSAVEFDMIGR